jgi:hypothetical protein
MTHIVTFDTFIEFADIVSFQSYEDRVIALLSPSSTTITTILAKFGLFRQPDILELEVKRSFSNMCLFAMLTEKGHFAALSRLLKLTGCFDRLFHEENESARKSNPLKHFESRFYKKNKNEQATYQKSLMIFLSNEHFIDKAETLVKKKKKGKVSSYDFPTYENYDERKWAEGILESVKKCEASAHPEQFCGGGWRAIAELQIAAARAWINVSVEIDGVKFEEDAFCEIHVLTQYPKYQSVFYYERALALMERYFAGYVSPQGDCVDVRSDTFQETKTFTLDLIKELERAAKAAGVLGIHKPYHPLEAYPLFAFLNEDVDKYEFSETNLQLSLDETFDAADLGRFAHQNQTKPSDDSEEVSEDGVVLRLK